MKTLRHVRRCVGLALLYLWIVLIIIGYAGRCVGLALLYLWIVLIIIGYAVR